MTYAAIDKKRFAQLLDWGADDEELRKFFADNRIQLIQKSAKVQNLPHGKPARVRMVTHGLPSATDRILQKWCQEHLTMLDPEPVVEVVSALRLYEEVGESPAEDEGKRLARSCLVHLFTESPAPELLAFLRTPQGGTPTESPDARDTTIADASPAIREGMSEPLAIALVALVEGRDPDEHLSLLPPSIATFVAALHAIRAGRDDETQGALAALESDRQAHATLMQFAAKVAGARAAATSEPRGLQLIHLGDTDDLPRFDFDRDEVIGICTRDVLESTFISPFAIRSASGSWTSLSRKTHREELFYTSGDLIAFAGGREFPKQPRRGDIGVWTVAQNRNSGPSHRTNFHIAAERASVFEVRTVPFPSTDYDSVRGFIKHQVEMGGPSLAKTSLFLLRDELLVGCPAGRDLTRDEGFEVGLPSWRALPAIRFEGRLLVPGPLPPSETYECEALGSSVRKLIEAAPASERPPKAQLRRLQELLDSGAVHLNSARASRLRAELGAVEEHEGVMDALLAEVMRDPKISLRVDALVQERVDSLVAKKEQLRKDIEQLERQKAASTEERRKTEKDQKAMAPAVTKAIRAAFEKANSDALGALGQTAVFKALMDELMVRPSSTLPPVPAQAASVAPIAIREPSTAGVPIMETLRGLGIPPKFARALEVVGRLAQTAGLILVVRGHASRVAAESWSVGVAKQRRVVECGIGAVDDSLIRVLVTDAPESIVILDASLSPLDVYARPLIDMVQRRVANLGDVDIMRTSIVLSVSDSIAALPVPSVVESVALQVSLDHIPVFLQESDANTRLEELVASDEPEEWFSYLWKPAAVRLVGHLRGLPLDELSLALSTLASAQSAKTI